LKIENCTITPSQEKAWNDTRSALLFWCPAFAHIFYSMMNNAHSSHIAVFTKDIPIAATDGTTLFINPERFFKYNLKERVFICAHEIMHCIWNHCALMHGFAARKQIAYADGTTLPYNQKFFNIATDLVINDLMIESDIGSFNKDWLHDTSIAVSTDSAIDAYKKVYKEGGCGKGKGFDEHLKPGTSQGKDAASAAAERNEAKWQTEIQSAVTSAKLQGKLPGALERWFGDNILSPQVDWKDKIRGLFARKVGSGSYDWQKPDRRLIVRDIIFPGRSGYGAGTVVIGGDTSGSVGAKTLNLFLGEIAGILEDVRPKRMVIMWCDAKLQRVDEIEDASDLNVVRYKGAPGGGGTKFWPVFNEIEKMGLTPDALVYLTDGIGTFPDKAPSYPVFWGSVYPQAKYPFGDVVDVPQQAA
jgi:predicted metal-dependent peptidase